MSPLKAAEVPLGVEDDRVRPFRPTVAPEPEQVEQDVAEHAESEHEQAVAHRLRALRADAEARRLYTAEQRPPEPGPGSTSLTALLAEPDEDAAYRIDDLWPSGGKVLLAAPAKAGKTTLVGNLVRSLADGARFLSRPVAPDGFKVAAAGYGVAPLGGRRVMVLDFEMNRRQLREWLRDQAIGNTDAVHVELMRGRTFDPRDPAERAQWAAYLRGLDVGVLVVDPLRPILAGLGLSQDSNDDVGQVLFALDALTREAGTDELFLAHHMGHGVERASGASTLLGWPDALWTIVKDAPTGTRAFSADGRDVHVSETALIYDTVTRRLALGEGDRVTARAVGDAEIIAGIVQDSPGESGNKIGQLARDTEIGTKRQRAQDAVKAAERVGLIHAHRGPNRARLHYSGGCGDTCHARDLPLLAPE